MLLFSKLAPMMGMAVPEFGIPQYLLGAGLGALGGAGFGALNGAIRGGGARGGVLAQFNPLPNNIFEGGSDNAMYGMQQMLNNKGIY